jgi:hypothetical protein
MNNAEHFVKHRDPHARTWGGTTPMFGFTPDGELAATRAALEARREGYALRRKARALKAVSDAVAKEIARQLAPYEKRQVVVGFQLSQHEHGTAIRSASAGANWPDDMVFTNRARSVLSGPHGTGSPV